MIWQTSPFVPALLFTACACAILGMYVWRHRPAPGVGPAAASFVISASWNAGYAMELSSANYAAQLFWANVQYVFIAAAPALMIYFALIYVGRGRLLSRRVVLLLCVEPVLVILLAFASESIPLLRAGGQQLTIDGYVIVAWAYGPLFWIHTLYSYGLMAWATIILVPVILRSPYLYRLQASMVVLGVMAPWVANAVYLFDLSPFPHLDLTPFSFFLYALAVGWALLRLRFLDVVPVARDSVVEGLQDAVLVLGMNGRIADANPAAQALLGGSASQLVGCQPADLPQHLAEILNLKGPVPSQYEIELDGTGDSARVFEVRLAAVHDHRGGLRGRVAVLHDLTGRKQAEEERVRSQRLLAAGEMAAGIAHNLNNILVGILAPARRLQDGETAQMSRDVSTIVTAAERARDLVQRLNLGSDDEAAIALVAVDVGTVIAEAIETSRPKWEAEARQRGVDIVLSTQLDPVPAARCDRTGLHDVVLNLLLNAADAMPAGGHLTVNTQLREGAIRLSVSDTGTGMDAETASRVLEPFFTTKVDIGTGLGLTTVYRSVKRWGGDLTIDSRRGVGSTFCLVLPLWDGDQSPSAPDEMALISGPAGVARILIAEDEAIVALVLADCARAMGHEVEVVHDGVLALDRLRGGAVDVAILDLGIPGCAGDVVASQAREQDRRLTTVLMTGWSLSCDDERLKPFDFLLQKPFDDRQARRVVDEAVLMSRQRHNGMAD